MNGIAITLLVVGALLAAGLAVWRIVGGPTNADRIVALDIFLAAGIALAIAASLATARTVFLDVAMAELEERLVGRWLSFGLAPDEARVRALSNDLPNARRVLVARGPVDVILRGGALVPG